MQTILPKALLPKTMARAVWLAITLAVSGMLSISAAGQALAGFCSATKCVLTLTGTNLSGIAGPYGTVTLGLLSNVVTVDVMLDSKYRIIVGGNGNGNAAGAIGFRDNLGGGLTIDNFKSGGMSTSLYQDFQSSDPRCITLKAGNCHWNMFGYANDAAALSGPPRSQSLQELSFTVSKGTSITDVHQLLQQFAPSGGNPSAYFTVDACLWDLKKRPNTCSTSTGLFGVMQVPEPGSLALLASGLLALRFLRWKRIV